jgi:hypothetical protein
MFNFGAESGSSTGICFLGHNSCIDNAVWEKHYHDIISTCAVEILVFLANALAYPFRNLNVECRMKLRIACIDTHNNM